MTDRERVVNALEFRESDVTPWTVDLTEEEHKKLVAHTGNPKIYESFGSHIVSE